MSRESASATPPDESSSATPPDFEDWMFDRRLETWDDPTPRETLFTIDDLREACVAAAKRDFSHRARSPTREERLKLRDEHDRNSLMIALQAYTKKKNMQLHPNLKDENDVYLCVPLQEKDSHRSVDYAQVECYGCKDRAADLVHPISGGFLGGHKDVGFPFMEFESDDDE